MMYRSAHKFTYPLQNLHVMCYMVCCVILQEWENEIVSLEKNEDMDNLITESIEEKIIALYGAEAGKKTWKEFKKEDKYIEINNVLSTGKMTISNQNVSYMVFWL